LPGSELVSKTKNVAMEFDYISHCDHFCRLRS
jgi:hypothetical protein